MILQKSVNFLGDENNLKHKKETQSSNLDDKLINNLSYSDKWF